MRWLLFCVLIGVLYLSGCAVSPEKKSPCNYAGTWCGKKQAINH